MLPLLVPEIEYLEVLDIEVLRTPLRGDRVYRTRYRNQEHILHFELETGPDGKMPYRLLDYHSYFLRKYSLPVISVIVYPFHTSVVESPLREMSGHEEVLTFHFRVICLWKLDAERFVREHIVSMYALLPTMRGANEALLRQAIDELVERYQHDDTKLARQFKWFGILLRRADIVPLEDKRRIQERLDMWDNLIEQDPWVQKKKAEAKAEGEAEGLAEGLAKGLAEGLAEGEVKGEVKGLQNAVVRIVKGRFPSLSELAQQKVVQVNEAPVLYYLVEQLSTAPDETVVRWLLRPSAA